MSLPAPIFAVAVVFLAAALAVDFELVTEPPSDPPICAKSLATCEMAIAAIHREWWAPDLRHAVLRCEARAGCFTASSLCIPRFNCPGDR